MNFRVIVAIPIIVVWIFGNVAPMLTGSSEQPWSMYPGFTRNTEIEELPPSPSPKNSKSSPKYPVFDNSPVEDAMLWKMQEEFVNEGRSRQTRSSNNPSYRAELNAKEQSILLMISNVVRNDPCKDNWRSGMSYCKERTRDLNNLPSMHRKPACENISDGKCRQVGNSKQYQCTVVAKTYKQTTMLGCISRKQAIKELTRTLPFKDCFVK